jgi:hypothetical protein
VLRQLLHGPELTGLVVAVLLAFVGQNLLQAWTARLLGDSRAVREGYGWIGKQQLDPLGVVCAVLTVGAWGWSAPVPMDARFARQRPRAVIALLTGPAYLFGLTVGAAALLRSAAHGSSAFEIRSTSAAFVCLTGMTVVSLAPFPPLPLGRALWLYAPTTPGWTRARYLFEEESAGSLLAFAFLMLPLIFSLFPDTVGDIVPHLERGVLDLLG